jgi:hypothetical protein
MMPSRVCWTTEDGTLNGIAVSEFFAGSPDEVEHEGSDILESGKGGNERLGVCPIVD